jgi:hypothetical protein
MALGNIRRSRGWLRGEGIVIVALVFGYTGLLTALFVIPRSDGGLTGWPRLRPRPRLLHLQAAIRPRRRTARRIPKPLSYPRPPAAPPAKFVGLAWNSLISGIVGVVFSWIPVVAVLTMLGAIVGGCPRRDRVVRDKQDRGRHRLGLVRARRGDLSLVISAFMPAMDQTREPISSQLSGGTPVPNAVTSALPINQVGQQFTNLGATVTVTMVRSASSIELNESNFRPGSGRESYTDTPVGSGASYVIVKADVVNNAKKSMDLTCSLPIRTVLIDDQDHNFDPIQDLYKVKGNPECNEALQPGFATGMTWVYRVPTATHVLGWAFEGTTDFSTIGHNEPTVVHI